MKNFFLIIILLGLVYVSPAQKNQHLLDGRNEQSELLKFKEQQLEQEQLKEQQFFKAQNKKLLKNNNNVAINADDRAILDSLYKATDGDNWTHNDGWLTDSSYWYGITLDSNGRVTAINLGNNKLSGTIPAELGNLTNLQMLNLYGNQLSDTIPATLGNLTNLYLLNLASNQLSGSIPATLGNLANLQFLKLDENQLSGTIPATLGNLRNLWYLGLLKNQLSGTIPSVLDSLTNLKDLYLEKNQFTGLPNLSDLVNLDSTATFVAYNFLDFGDLENSGINWYSYAPQANIVMSETVNGDSITFSVSVEDTNNVYKWYKNDVEISGETVDSLTIDSITGGGIYYCEITNTGFPDLILTSDAKEIDTLCLTNGVMTNEYNALIALYDSTNGDNWIYKTNWKSTQPVDYWYGVTVSGAHITKIGLSENKLCGSIPSELGNLTNLQTLSLSGNQLSDTIPATIGNLTNLQELSLVGNQLSGTIPATLGNLTNLQTLYLSINQLSGSIPDSLGNLTNLQWLDLYSNQLSGSIPTTIGNLTNLQFLQLGENQLSGSIPATIGNLTNLQKIYLSRNQISGSIPATIGNLTNLQRLDLYSNQLSGSIPSELDSLTNLNYLYLNENQFTSLPDLSDLNLSYSTIKNNFLDFGDLENSNISWTSYAPQANVSISKTANGDSITFSVSVGGTNNNYQWYKNDAEISGETADSLTVDSITGGGIYYCKITNTDFPLLVLTSVAQGVGSIPLTNGVMTNEYNALIALYDATNGNNWANNTNWETSQPVDYWYGVTVSSAHITEVNLSSNQLSGSIPAELDSLTNLQKLDLSDNQLNDTIPATLDSLKNLQELHLDKNQFSSLPNLSDLVYLYSSAVENNFLDFDDLESSGISWTSYAPQAKVGTVQNIVLSDGQSDTISVSVDGSNNTYQWYKDGTTINGASNSEYIISDFNEANDAGVYVCKIKDSNYPDLTLESNNITVSNEASIATDANGNAKVSIYPNPVSNILSIHFSKGKAEMLRVLDLKGKQIFSSKVNSETEIIDLSNLESGVYILQLQFENQIIDRKIIKD